MTKKIILLLVEGPTDEDALALVYSKLVREHDLEFDVLHTDITAGEDMTVKYIEERIQKEVMEYLRKHPYIEKDDILKVVQIIDTDGAFIPAAQVQQSETGKTEYFETHIAARNKDRLIRRNISKRRIVYHLMKSEEVAGFPYEIYYFSRNMEHVLHDISEDLYNPSEYQTDMDLLLADCSHYEKRIMYELVKAVKAILRDNYELANAFTIR